MTRQTIDSPARQERRLKMSYEEYLAFVDDSTHSEWVDGEVTIFMPPKIVHMDLAFFLARLIAGFSDRFKLGKVFMAPTEMRIRGGGSYREPDILFVARAHLDRITEDRIDGAADLVIEIVSDDSVRRDRIEKFNEYAAAGIPEYWMVDPRLSRRTTDFFRLGPSGGYEIVPLVDGRFHSDILPGFWLDPAWLWQDPLPDVDTVLGAVLSRP